MTENQALVVFHGIGRHWARRFLRKGFQHVFVAVQVRHAWVRIDPALGTPLVEAVCAPEFDLATFYRNSGFTVVETTKREVEFITPFFIANCVGVVKAVLGVRAPLVWTPYQLYKHLIASRASTHGGLDADAGQTALPADAPR